MNSNVPIELHDELAAACADAGVDPATVRIWFFDEDPLMPGTPPSVHYPPGWPVEEDSDPIFDDKAGSEANDGRVLQLHRIAVRAGVDFDDRVAVTAVIGLIRHEVEHARQYSGPDARELKNLDWLAGVIAAHLDGADGVEAYRSKPVEASANAAAARFLKRRHPEHRAGLADGKFAPFAEDGGTVVAPPQLERLIVEWISQREPMVDEVELFDDGLAWDERLDAEMPGASRWRKETG